MILAPLEFSRNCFVLGSPTSSYRSLMKVQPFLRRFNSMLNWEFPHIGWCSMLIHLLDFRHLYHFVKASIALFHSGFWVEIVVTSELHPVRGMMWKFSLPSHFKAHAKFQYLYHFHTSLVSFHTEYCFIDFVSFFSTQNLGTVYQVTLRFLCCEREEIEECEWFFIE